MDVENRLVKKSNTAISSRVKGYSLNQMKIMNLAISELTESTTADDVLSFQAIDLLKAIGLGEKNHAELRKATLDMIRGIEIPRADGGFSQVPIFSEIEYFKGGTVEIKFHAKVLPLLVQAKTEYTKYYFQNIQRLKSTYSVKIYELCKQYQNTKQGYRDLTIDELKIFLDIPLTKYPRFADFNRRVINHSVNEITDKTDLKVDAEPIKKGRSTTGIRFYITLKNREQQVGLEQPALPCDFKDQSPSGRKLVDDYLMSPSGRKLVDDYFMSPSIAVELQVMATSDEHLLYAIDEYNKKVDARNKKGADPIKNPAKHSEAALRESLPIILSSGVLERKKAEAEEKLKQAEVKKKAQQKLNSQKREKDTLNQEFKAFCEREDLSDVLKFSDIKALLDTVLDGEYQYLYKEAQKECENIFSKPIVNLMTLEIFDVLKEQVTSLSFPPDVKPIKYRNLRLYLKHVLRPLF